MGKELGYEGQNLQDFIKQQQDDESAERQAQRGVESVRIADKEKDREIKLAKVAAQDKNKKIELARIAAEEAKERRGGPKSRKRLFSSVAV